MRKKLRKFSIILILVILASLAFTSFASADGPLPRRPKIRVTVESCVQVKYEWRRFGPGGASVHTIETYFVNGTMAYFYDFPHDQSPLTLNYGLPVNFVWASWHWGPSGGADNWIYVGAPPCPDNDCYVAPNSQVRDGISVRFLGTGICTTSRLRPKGGGAIVHFPGGVTREGFDRASGKWWYRAYFGGGPADTLQCKDYHVGVFGNGGGFEVLGFYNPCD